MTVRSEVAKQLSPLFVFLGMLMGFITGLAVLTYWYLVLGPVGLTTVAIGGVTFHHGIVGIISSVLGVSLAVAPNPIARTVGGFFMGFGFVILGEDILQHCFVVPNPDGSCSSII